MEEAAIGAPVAAVVASEGWAAVAGTVAADRSVGWVVAVAGSPLVVADEPVAAVGSTPAVGADVAVAADSVGDASVEVASPPPQAMTSRPNEANANAASAVRTRDRLEEIAAANGQPVKDNVASRDNHES